jgi:hypothetical protein
MSENRMEFLQDNLRVFVVPVDILESIDLTTHEKMVYIVLRSFANPHKPQVFPSYETIARLGSMTRRHAINCVRRLVELGYINKEVRLDVSKNRKIKNTSNLYTLQKVKKDLGSECGSPSLVNTVHPPSEYSSPEHNHLKIKEDDDINTANQNVSKSNVKAEHPTKNQSPMQTLFTQLVVDNKLNNETAAAILKELSNDLDQYQAEAIKRTFKKAIRRIRNQGISNIPRWFASTLRNEQTTLEQTEIKEQEFIEAENRWKNI